MITIKETPELQAHYDSLTAPQKKWYDFIDTKAKSPDNDGSKEYWDKVMTEWNASSADSTNGSGGGE